MKKQSEDRWKPRRYRSLLSRGLWEESNPPRRVMVERYCSPACGGGCTLRAFEEKRAAAVRLCKRLGAGWKVVMSENLGWFANLHHESLGIRVSFDFTPSTSKRFRVVGYTVGFIHGNRTRIPSHRNFGTALHSFVRVKKAELRDLRKEALQLESAVRAGREIGKRFK